MNRYYLTTPIYYINGLPHIGHVFTTVLSDIIARYHRLSGEDVYFLTGTDEHGQKAEKAAKEAGITPEQMAEQIAAPFRDLWKQLNISNNDFIRTTEPRHYDAVQEMFRRQKANGDIYLGEYEGWYCTSDEAFWTEGQLVNGNCPDCGRKVDRISEPSYFFRLSKYQEPLLKFYRENPRFVVPQGRFNEVIRFVEGGLKDLSVSRQKLRWGIPVPDDPSHVIYVWFDALTNYITGIGFPKDLQRFRNYWPADLHVIGKDIVRFHAVYWPAFLMSAGIETPRQLLAHGWWMRDDTKISKSRGNVVDPDILIRKFGVDGLRYFLAREAPLEADSSYNHDTILRRVNSDLANDLGNLCSRALTMVHRYCGGQVPPGEQGSSPFQGSLESIAAGLKESLRDFAFPRLLSDVWAVVGHLNRHIVEEQPWVLATDPAQKKRLDNVLYNSCEALRFIAALIGPVVPASADMIWSQLGLSERASEARVEDLVWGRLAPGTRLAEVTPIFPRIEEKEAAPVTVGEKKAETPVEAQGPPPEYVGIEDFQKMGLRVAEIKAVEKIAGSKKLYRIQVDLGTETRQLVAGIAEAYSIEELIGRQIIVVTNLKPAKLMGVESRGMLLAASVDGKPVLAGFTTKVPNGTIVK
ncbi:MAG TPA: methionine--tRNA ligase [Acidobacteriota bacterium]|nr:methionine--tRNA ligase [Acidobacteriota bacterium]